MSCDISGMQFIDTEGYFIQLCRPAHYATLYHVSSPKIQGYLDMGISPHPNVFSVSPNQNIITTAPQANILVTGQANYDADRRATPGIFSEDDGKFTGINIYRFDKKNKTLTLIWAPEGPPKHRRYYKS